MNGRPLTIDWIATNIQAVLETWFLGDQAGNAIADILFGDYNPSGKLTTTFPRSVGQIPLFYNHMNTGRPPSKTDKYTSKYIDSPVSPLYPFGYGLSYTTFDYSNLRIDKTKISKVDSLNVSIDVTNSGKRNGVEVVQLYIRDVVASVTRPVKELKGFKRVNLQPEKTKTIKFMITPDMLSFYNKNMEKVVEHGDFDIMVGSSSDKYLTTAFNVVK